jgi:HD superfamily phosphodiesterase
MIIQKAEDFVKTQYHEDFFKYHVLVVRKCALRLAETLGGDKEIIELAVLFHDSTIQNSGNSDHHITGAENAEKFLLAEGYPTERIAHIKKCILTHRFRDATPESIEAKILASADAEAHFRTFPFVAYFYIKNKGAEKAFHALQEKVDRDWNKKMLPESQAQVNEHYKIIKKMLEEID